MLNGSPLVSTYTMASEVLGTGKPEQAGDYGVELPLLVV